MNELNKLIEALIKEKGGTKKQYLHLLNSIANHETGDTLSSTQKQVGGGPGRGKYQFEIGKNKGGITAARRLKDYYTRNNNPIPKWLDKSIQGESLDVTTLTPEQQDVLYLGNMREHPRADLANVMSGKETVPDFWANYHWSGPRKHRKERIENFKGTYTPLQNINEEPFIPETEVLGRKFSTKEEIPVGMYAYGGSIGQALYGGSFSSYGVGGRHETNPNGGVMLGPKASVEQGETSFNFRDMGKYIFSNRITSSGVFKK